MRPDSVLLMLGVVVGPSPASTENPVHTYERQFGLNLPTWLVAVLSALVAAAILLGLLKPLAPITNALFRIIKKPFSRPSADEVYTRQRWRRFADYHDGQLRWLAAKEDWRDDRFAELEAEVEVEGRERISRWLRGSPSREVALRREKSLSRALERSTERLIILEGEPGSGKSVALRHVAQRMARQAADVHDPGIVPLYVNLKEFRPTSHPVDGAEVRQFIISNANRVNDRDVEQFLEEEFDRGLAEGKWLLLLDSFDEIPEVLAATESDAVVEEYTDAIYNFLHGMNSSRGVVASREFRGPRTAELPKFRIMPLTARQRTDLVRRSGLDPEGQRLFNQQMAVAEPDLRQMSANPMFLSLVCEHVQAFKAFPPNSYTVFETYLARRFSRDAARIQRRYGANVDFVRRIAEESAFCMAITPSLGLSPSRRDLYTSLVTTNLPLLTRLDTALDALEYIKIGRSVEELAASDGQLFTFAHRRFQEYFATCVVLREPERVPVGTLLEDGRWRETVVTILQAQPTESIQPLLEAIGKRLSVAAENLQTAPGGIYRWPPGALYLLGTLNAGMGRRAADLPGDIRRTASEILLCAWENGRRHDRKWAVELAVVAEHDIAVDLLSKAFGSGSAILRDAAYQSTSRLANPPEKLITRIRQALGLMAVSGRLRAERLAVEAEVRRLADPDSALRAMRLLLSARFMSWTLLAGIWAAAMVAFPYSIRTPYLESFLLGLALVLVVDSYITPVVLVILIEEEVGGFGKGAHRMESEKFHEIHFGLPIVMVAGIGARSFVPLINQWFFRRKPFVHHLSFSVHAVAVIPFLVALLLAIWYWCWPYVVAHSVNSGGVGPAQAITRGPILLAMPYLPKSREAIVRSIRDNLRTVPIVIAAAIAMVAIGGGLIFGAVLLIDLIYKHITRFLNDIFLFGFLPIAGLTVLGLLGGSVATEVSRRRLLAGLRTRSLPLNSSDFARIVERAYDETMLLQVVRLIHERESLRTNTIILVLADFAFAAEHGHEILNQETVPEWVHAETSAWISEHPAAARTLSDQYGNLVLDEISRLLEETETAAG